MSWLKVPSALEDTPRSSNASTSSDTRRTGQTDSSYTSSSGSYSYSDDSVEASDELQPRQVSHTDPFQLQYHVSDPFSPL